MVTANKELLANFGRELFEAAAAAGVDLLFEASVCGGIPLIRPLRESLAGDRIRRLMGIVNGTTNFVLTRMAESGASFHDALAEAQSLGYAERDPTADVEGFDAAAKAAIIASIAFGAKVVAGDVYREGISSITAADIDSARDLGYVVKLLAIAEEVDGEVAVRVHPAMVPVAHPAGLGAGLVQRRLHRGRSGRATSCSTAGARAGCPPPRPSSATWSTPPGTWPAAAGAPPWGRSPASGCGPSTRWRPSSTCSSRWPTGPGVLAAIAATFGQHGVSIKSMQQQGMGDDARLIFVTHKARERDFEATMHAVRRSTSSTGRLDPAGGRRGRS